MRVTQRLARLALIDRAVDDEDRRRVRLSLNGNGRAFLQELAMPIVQTQRALLADLDDRERGDFVRWTLAVAGHPGALDVGLPTVLRR